MQPISHHFTRFNRVSCAYLTYLVIGQRQKRYRIKTIRPISIITGDAPIEFNIAAQNDLTYLDLKKSTVYVKVRIIKGSGDKIETTQEVASINLLLPALFSQVDVFVQNRLVSSSTGNYSYKAMLQTLLKYGKSSKQTQFTSQLWYDDTPGFMDDCNVQNGRNIELYQSYTFF